MNNFTCRIKRTPFTPFLPLKLDNNGQNTNTIPMKKLILFSLVSLLITFSSIASDRQSEHDKAGETFLNFHFFENGRGMTISPNMSKLLWMIDRGRKNNKIDQDPITNFISSRYGFIQDNNKLVGVFEVPWKGMDIGVLGCTGCHSGKAAGIVVPGLGNKTIDSYQIGKDLLSVQRFWGIGVKDENYKYVHNKAINFAKVISDPNLANLVRGVVSDSTIKTFFYKDQGLDYPKDMGRAQVKVPHLWGVAQKRESGIFNDGSLSGEGYGWIFGAELFASDSGEHLRAVLPKIKWLTDQVLGKLLPPKYPFELDEQKVTRGENLFNQSCIKCHGDHHRDLSGFPIYDSPKVIKKEVVGTDTEKLKAISEEFIGLVRTSSLGDVLTFKEDNIQKGYFAPKLWGIWSRFPYLHNGSVPTLYHMMLPPNERPQVFSMKDAGEAHRYDKPLGGLTLLTPRQAQRAIKAANRGSRDIYHVEKEGLSNKGHYFAKYFDQLKHQDRMDIVEYLKSLN